MLHQVCKTNYEGTYSLGQQLSLSCCGCLPYNVSHIYLNHYTYISVYNTTLYYVLGKHVYISNNKSILIPKHVYLK